MTIAAIELLHIAPQDIDPDPANPRGILRDLDALAASIDSVGLLQAITVRMEKDRYIVINGHRRLAASRQLNLPRIPCILVSHTQGDLDRATERLVENLQRDDLSAVETAKAFQQMLDLGVAEEDLSTVTGLAKVQVNEALSLAKSAVAIAVSEKHDLTMEQALVLAEFEDDKEVIKNLTRIALKEPENWAHAVAEYRDNRLDAEALADVVIQCEALGMKWTTDHPGYAKGRPIADLNHVNPKNSGPMRREAHKECPGHVVYLKMGWGRDHKIVQEDWCTDYRGNAHRDRHGGSGSGNKKPSETVAEKEKASKERRELLACNKAGARPEPVRRQFVRDLLKRTSVPKGMERFVTLAIATPYQGITSRSDLFGDLVGIKDNAYSYGAKTVQAKFIDKLPETRVILGLLAHVATAREADFEPNTWRHPSDARIAYLRFLVSVGYVPSLIEKVIMGQAKPAEVVAAAERLKASGPPQAPTPKATSPKKRVAKRITPAAKKPAPAKRQAVRRRAPAKPARTK